MKRFLPILLSLFFILLLVFYLSSRVLAFFSPYLPYVNYLLGVDRPTSYLVLLGNDAEMRANGGFAGSYAKISVSLIPSTKHLALSTDFQDIYVPNGQIAGLFVAPPEPIQQAFGHGSWELANADWEPDFPTAAKSLRWFLEKGGEINPDILAILNLSTIKKVLGVVGSFPVPEYQATLTPDNLYLFLQGKAELNFFPGSTQKKDALTAVGGALIKKIGALSLLQKFQIARVLYLDFQNQNLMVNSASPAFQAFLVEQGLAGQLQPEAFDTYSLVETNLGANKANAFVTRQTTHTITLSSAPSTTSPAPSTSNPALSTSLVHHSVTIKFVNSSPEANPQPPFHYGGHYIAYLRLYLPLDAQNITLTRTPEGKPPLDLPSPTPPLAPSTDNFALRTTSPAPSTDNFALRTNHGLTELGFWHTTQAGGESTISLSYDLPLPCASLQAPPRVTVSPCHLPPRPYSLAILKQHGQLSSPQTISLFDRSLATDLTQDFHYP